MMRNKLFVTLLAGVCLAAVWAGWYNGKLTVLYADYPVRGPLQTRVPNFEPLVIAQRGYSRVAPENTLPAIEAAIAAGLDYVEIDIRLTADNVPVAFHDRGVDRTTNGQGKLASYTFAELRKLDAGSWFGNEFAGTFVPTLQEALDSAQGRICFVAHIKEIPSREVVSTLRSFAAVNADYCLLVTLLPLVGFEEFGFKGVPADIRETLAAGAAINDRIYAQQYRVFERYWPEFPYVHAMKRGDTPGALLEKYPGLAALILNSRFTSADVVRDAHALGLLTYQRVLEEAEDDNVYRKAMAAGIDALFLLNIDGMHKAQAEYKDEFLQENRQMDGLL